jgi:hypothetical protein
VITYAVFLPFFMIDQVVMLVGTGMGDILSGLSVAVAKEAFTQGLVDTHGLVLHGLLVFLFLYLSAQILDSNRWR